VIPGIFYGTVVAGFVGRAHGELVHVGFAKRDHTGSVDLFDAGGAVGSDKVIEHLRAAAGFNPFCAEDIFLHDGDAGQLCGIALFQAEIGGACGVEGALFGDGNEAIEQAIVFSDSGEKSAGQLFAGEFTSAQSGRQFSDAFIMHCGS